jgi:hypothetical protein
MRRLRRFLQAAVLLLTIVGASAAVLDTTDASAAVAHDASYTYDQTFGTALRMVRVDMGLKITEKDTESGYILFEYKSPESGGRSSNGSIEIVRGKQGVHVTVQLPSMPKYHEQVMMDALIKKLASEHGEPQKKPKPAPPPPVDDAGAGEPPVE